MGKPRPKPGGVWKFVLDSSLSPEELEDKKLEDVTNMLGMLAFLGDRQNPFAAAEEMQNYFPGDNKVPDGGAWVMIKHPPHTEYTVPPLSFWYAEPWPHQGERHCSHRVKIVTPKGELGLYPREYSLVTNPEKYYEFVGEGMQVHFFGQEDGVPKDKLFYLRSRGIAKADALTMLIGSIKAHGVLWIETAHQYAEYFGLKRPHDKQLATV